MKVAISTPLRADPTLDYTASLLRTVHALNHAGIEYDVLLLPGDTYVHHARDALLRMYLSSDATHLFMIDDDIGWKADDFLRLLYAPHPVVAALYRMRHDYAHFAGQHAPDTETDAHGCLAAERLPTGFMRITRDVAQAAWDAETVTYLGYDGTVQMRHVFFAGARTDGLWWSEDYVFCEKVRALGFPLHLMPDVTLAHVHRTAHLGNYAQALREQARAAA